MFESRYLQIRICIMQYITYKIHIQLTWGGDILDVFTPLALNLNLNSHKLMKI